MPFFSTKPMPSPAWIPSLSLTFLGMVTCPLDVTFAVSITTSCKEINPYFNSKESNIFLSMRSINLNTEIEMRDPLSICHCEYPEGAWQSELWNVRLLHFVRNDNVLYRDSGS